MKRLVLWAVFFAIVTGIFLFFKPRRWPPGVLVAREPVQVMLDPMTPAFQKDGFTIEPLASYEIDARILHKKRYGLGPSAKIAPYDFAVGWGVMSDQSVLDKLDISQGNRFYFYEYALPPPVEKREITVHSANMHLIPADSSVMWALWRANTGDLVRMRGKLVQVSTPDMPAWRSSLSRTDTGNGACELMWIESIQRLSAEEMAKENGHPSPVSLSSRL